MKKANKLVGSCIVMLVIALISGPLVTVAAAAPKVSAGFYHGLFMSEHGQLWSWGANDHGQLGDGTTIAQETPMLVFEQVSDISAGGLFNLIKTEDGKLWSWGSNGYGQLGDGTTTEAHKPAHVLSSDGVPSMLLEDVATFSSGGWHSLALKNDGTVWTWGRETDDQVNDEGTSISNVTTDQAYPKQVTGLPRIIAVSAGGWHSMALAEDGTVYAWGSNQYGQLGDGTKDDAETPIQVPGLTGITQISAGFYHNLVVDSNGEVWVWGHNTYGQLGDGTTTDSFYPKKLNGIGDVADVSTGYYHSLALKTDGTVWAWGNNEYGQLGIDSTVPQATPVQTQQLDDVIAISAGGYTSLAVDQAGGGWSWGLNKRGQLGDRTTVDRKLPVRIQFPQQSLSLSTPPGSTPGPGFISAAMIESVDVQLFINGTEYKDFAKGMYRYEMGREIIEVKVEEKKLAAELEDNEAPTVTIKVNSPSDAVVALLGGGIIQQLADNNATLELRTPIADYIIPAAEISVRSVLEQFDAAPLEDIQVRIDIAHSSEETVKQAEDAALNGKLTMVVEPIDFAITFSDGHSSLTKDHFFRYLRREIPLPSGVTPDEITTAAVLQDDGTVRHAPTKFITRNGTDIAVVNSLSNSPYLLVRKELQFADTAGHWAEQQLNSMASRLIVFGVDDMNFVPENNITRAELTVMVIRALGIHYRAEASDFPDVGEDAWYVGAVSRAKLYGLVEGYEDGYFRPDAPITRLEAIAIISRAMNVAGLESSLSEDEIDAILSAFSDGSTIAEWARPEVAAAVEHGIITGSDGQIKPNQWISRAEKAAMVWRLLRTAELID